MLRLILIFVCFAIFQLEGLSLEEKAGQILMVHFSGERVNEDARILVQELNVGAVIYYGWSNGLRSAVQIRTLSKDLQELTKNNRNPIPLLIAIDQEGGAVTRLKEGFTQFPSNYALGATNDPLLAEAAAIAMGLEMKSVGINMNLAPVVDVNLNPLNSAIGERSFGNDPEKVAVFGKKALEGYHQAGIFATLKHFPGHGDVRMDSHAGLPTLDKSMDRLEEIELFPFAQLAPYTDAVMTAHLLVPAFDPFKCSTLSEKTLNYLKEVIGFQGVIITDSLVMQGVLDQSHTVDEAAIEALKAGCDLLLLGGRQLFDGNAALEITVKDVRRIHASLVEAVKSGRISEERLDEAVRKILHLKKSLE